MITIVLAASSIFWITGTASAATFTVTNVNDSGAGSLRQALLDAGSNAQDDVIVFDNSVFNVPRTIILTSGELAIGADMSSGTKSTTINGPGANLLTIDGNNNSRIFDILAQGLSFIDGLRLVNGNGLPNLPAVDINANGGAIYVGPTPNSRNLPNLTLTNSVITGNRALQNIANGGGIMINGGAWIVNCAIYNNQGLGFGGGVAIIGGAIIQNTTISHNMGGGGGGIYVNFTSTLALTNSTVAYNTATSAGGGVRFTDSSPSAPNISFTNSIIANNTTSYPVLAISDVYSGSARITTSRNTIFGSSQEVHIQQDLGGNQLDVDPKLGVGENTAGGTVPGLTLHVDSPAIDHGSNCVLTLTTDGGCTTPDTPNIVKDFRGVARPQDGDGDGTATVDIGAFEAKREELLVGVTGAPDLQPASDSGSSNIDNITSDPNPVFTIDGVTPGAFVELLRDGYPVTSLTAVGTSINLADSNLSLNGTHTYSTRETISGVAGLEGPVLYIIFDSVGPTATVNQAAGQVDPAKTQPINFTVTFNESVIGFDQADLSLSRSTAAITGATLLVTGSSPTFNVQVSGVGDGTIILDVLPGGIQDIAGNVNSTQVVVDNSVFLDTLSPTVTINQATAQLDPTRITPLNFTVVFSEPVTGFTNADVSLTGSTANVTSATKTVTGSGTTYNVAVSNFQTNGGTVVATIPALGAQDAAGNLNAASTSSDNTVTVDNIAPTVTINQAPGQSDPTNILPINFSVVFSEPVTGFAANDITFTGSTLSTTGAVVTVTGSGAIYNVAVSNLSSNGNTLRASVLNQAASDGLGNLSPSSTSTDNNVVLDTIGPTVTINQAIGQSDPARTQPIKFSVFFPEVVTGLGPEDISLAGSTADVSAANIVVTGSGTAYTVSVSDVKSSGVVRASVVAGAILGTDGNPNTASSSNDNSVTLNLRRTLLDYDGDNKADPSVFRPSSGTWYSLGSQSGFAASRFGLSTDIIVPADFTGDGKTDVAVFRPSTGVWYVLRSEDFSYYEAAFGTNGDIPTPGDYDGDGKADLAVYRPSQGTWYLQQSTAGFAAVQFGIAEDKPAIGDFDGDGKNDISVYRPSTNYWYRLNSSNATFVAIQFGAPGDLIVPADYTGDGKTDMAVWGTTTGTWYVLRSDNLTIWGAGFGQVGDLPAPADYDGDGKADLAVWRPGSQAIFYVQGTTSGFSAVQWGKDGDIPTAGPYVY